MNHNKISTKKIGDFCPYYYQNTNKIVTASTFKEINNQLDNSIRWKLDVSAILSLINFNYIQGDRTLIQDVYRMPWHSLITEENTIRRNPPIPHLNNIFSPSDIAGRFIELLTQEFIEEFSDFDNIWILQTGGLDSRVTLAIIRKLSSEGRIKANINLITWGDIYSRDVIYSKQLAEKYHYNWKHINFDKSILKQNFEIAVNFGAAEVSAFHYHGMAKLKEIASSKDCIIASSFGDSIGRAEYSGIHLSDLKLIDIYNPYSLFNSDIFRTHKEILEKDRALAWVTDREQSKVIKNELDMQENYMRRMIGHAMDFIRSFTTLKQTFTSHELVSFAYSISPIFRNFDTYFHILKLIDPSLLEVPWARTGVSLLNDSVDNNKRHSKHYHNYDNWFFEDYYSITRDVLFNGQLVKNKIISKLGLSQIFRKWEMEASLSELVSKLYQIELLISRYDLKIEPQEYKISSHLKNSAKQILRNKFGILL